MLQVEAGLQAAAEVFGATEAQARRVVLHRNHAVVVAELLAFNRSVQATPQGDGALSESRGGNSGQRGDECNLLHWVPLQMGCGGVDDPAMKDK